MDEEKGSRISVLVVDDSSVQREFLTAILRGASNLEVIGTAKTGREALEVVDRLRPAVIVMDLNMPGIDGIAATRLIMERRPTPILVVTAESGLHDATAFRAMEAGALAFVGKPSGIGAADHAKSAKELVRLVETLAEVKVVRRWPSTEAKTGPLSPSSLSHSKPSLIAIGASTGGPLTLKTVLEELGPAYSIPILVVQHMAKGFTVGMADWLGRSLPIEVKIPSDLEPIAPGRAYLAPDDFHMGIDARMRITLSQASVEHSMRPAVSFLFRSVLRTLGAKAVGVLLTGMGEDGAEELNAMKDAGALTFAQDRESSVVYGMPGKAVELGGACYVLPPAEIGAALRSLGQVSGRARHRL